MVFRSLAVALVVGGLLVLGLASCNNVAQMQRKYTEGDESQLDRIIEIVANPQYPYATRRSAARVLGEIGDPRGVHALIGVLGGYDQRTTLKGEAIRSLGKIGDTLAVEPIGRLLDRSLNDPNADLRMAALPVLGDLGGKKSARILINALRYYDILMLQEEQKTFRGAFTGEEMDFFGADRDSTGVRRGPPRGLFDEQQSQPTSLFGTDAQFAPMPEYNPTPEERRLAHESLVKVGALAVPIVLTYLETESATPSLRRELLTIVAQIDPSQELPAAAIETAPIETQGLPGAGGFRGSQGGVPPR